MKNFLKNLGILILIFGIFGGIAYDSHLIYQASKQADASYIPNTNVAYWVKVTKAYSAFSTAGLTNDISIYTLPIKGYIHDVKIVPTTAFSGGLISAYTVSVGIGGALTKYAIATNTFTGNTTVSTIHTPLPGLESTSGTTDIRAQAVSVTGLLNAATAGSVDIYLLVSTLP